VVFIKDRDLLTGVATVAEVLVTKSAESESVLMTGALVPLLLVILAI
jgi:hypothetical protein